MIKQEKLKEISMNLTSEPENFMLSFRKNLFLYVNDKDITINDISEKSNIPFSTLNSFLYGKSSNMRIDNVIKLAKTLEISVDELTGAGTIPVSLVEMLSVCRNLPDNLLFQVKQYIEFLIYKSL